jgi:choline dehydrogenase-like flavoprotein
VLRLIESPLVNLLLTRRARSFRTMSPATREQYLLSWANSRVPLRRSAFQGFRKLLTFLAYADPGVERANPRFSAMGYVPEARPVAAQTTRIRSTRPPFESGSPDEPMEMGADAVVVGSGAGGGVVAAELARAGRSVVVLEAGPLVDEASMPTDELDAYGRLYLNHGLLSTWDGSVTMLAGAAVGGGTLVNWMTCLPAPTWVRDEWSRDHGIEDLTGETWDADLRAIEQEVSVSEATLIPPKDEVILRGAAELGWEAGLTRRNSIDCGDCGSCSFGCRQGTKQSGILAHLASAFAAGARIVPGARVSRVLLAPGTGNGAGGASGVEAIVQWTDPETGAPAADGRTRRVIVRAKSVVLSAGALRTPAILEASGVGHPAIGKNLRLQPVPVVAALFPQPIDMWRGTMQAARSLEFVEPGPGNNGYVIESAPGHPGLFALALAWEGTDAHADVMLRARRVAPLVGVTRDGGTGRATLTRRGTVRVDYRLDGTGIATLRHALLSMARLARAAGATEIVAMGTRPAWYGRSGFPPGGESTAFAGFEAILESFDFRPNRGTIFSAHQMGTVRMGTDPRDHPCDVLGRVRGDGRNDRVIHGLYVADGSLCPTGIGVNPMITIMVLARRVSRTILVEA